MRILLITPYVSHTDVPHAGGRYLHTLLEVLGAEHQVTVVAPNHPAAREAATQPGAPARLHLVDAAEGTSWRARGVRRLAAHLSSAVSRLDQGMTLVPLAIWLCSASGRQQLRQAEVVDLQWMEAIRLAPVVRLVAPRVRILGTYHDVQSQLFRREAEGDPLHARRWRWQARISRCWEWVTLRVLDEAIVFSEKDAALLPAKDGAVSVVRPPLARPDLLAIRRDHPEPLVLFISYLARPENDDAARWLLTDIWPRVVQERPDARLALIGKGASPALEHLTAADDTVDLVGFVADLTPWLERASAQVVPLRWGAGVKFKTVESLLAGTPTVTTPVGAEGVGGPELFEALSDDPAELAAGLMRCLERSPMTLHRAAAARVWTRGEFDSARFATRMDAIRAG